jgi:hypothetical protein
MENQAKTHKAGRTNWRENVMNALNLNYTIVNDQIIYKGSIGEYKTLVGLLVSEAKKKNIQNF